MRTYQFNLGKYSKTLTLQASRVTVSIKLTWYLLPHRLYVYVATDAYLVSSASVPKLNMNNQTKASLWIGKCDVFIGLCNLKSDNCA